MMHLVGLIHKDNSLLHQIHEYLIIKLNLLIGYIKYLKLVKRIMNNV